MDTLIKAHNEEIRAVMQKALNGELPEVNSTLTIILLQRELIARLSLLISQHTPDASAALMEESAHHSEAA